LRAISESLQFGFLLLKLFDLGHDGLSVFDLALFSKLLGILVIDINFGLELVNFLVDALLLKSVHLWLGLHF